MSDSSSVPGPSRPTEVARLQLSNYTPDAPLDEVFRLACKLSADAVEVERVGVWLFIDHQTILRCANLYERSKNEHSAGAFLRVSDYPTYFGSLKIRKAVPAEVASSAPWTKELAESYLQPLGITSILNAGIFVEGELKGVVCHEHVGLPREWTTEQRDFVGSMADLLALRIQSAEVRDIRAAFLTQRDRLAQQDKECAQEQLAAGIAHDFRNLLTIFQAHGELISIQADLPSETRDQGTLILETAEQGIALVEDLLAYSRPTPKPPTVMQLQDVVREFLPVLKETVGRSHRVRYTHPEVSGQVFVDKTEFTRALLNLVVNARDAMSEGGEIAIRLSPVALKGNPSYTGRFVMLEVTDRGVGMDERTRRAVFDPFYTTKSKGTGLGLSIVRKVVDRAGGFLRVESEPGKGTTFRLFFPRIGTRTGGTEVYTIPDELSSPEA